MNKAIIDAAVRRVQDFPKPGICFYDITSILTKPKVFKLCIDEMLKLYENEKIDAVAAIEARGFIFAAPFAVQLEVPLILVRKKGKLPCETYSSNYNLEYGNAAVEVHKNDIKAGQRILILDDLIATGGTLNAARKILEKGGAEVIGFLGVIGLPFLHYEKLIGDKPVKTLIEFNDE